MINSLVKTFYQKKMLPNGGSFYIGLGGFTVIELLVSISIIGVLSALFVSNYRGSNRAAMLNMAAHQLSSNIRLMQNNSLSIKRVGTDPSNKGAWGVSLTVGSSQYSLFADVNNSGKYESGVDVLYSSLTLPQNVSLTDLRNQSGSIIAANRVDAIFLPPDPTVSVMYDGGSIDSSSSTVATLEDSVSGQRKKVKLNYFGLIDVE